MDFYHYSMGHRHLVSQTAGLPLPAAAENWAGELIWHHIRESAGRIAFRPSHPAQVTAPESAAYLDPARLPAADVPAKLAAAVAEGRVTAVNGGDPRWQEALTFTDKKAARRRLHLLAVGDVGGTVLTGLKLLGGDCLHTIGICDLNPATVARYTAEMSQVSLPWEYDALPDVVPVDMEHLFDCDVFLFAATAPSPPWAAP